jgi:hypothetical protein
MEQFAEVDETQARTERCQLLRRRLERALQEQWDEQSRFRKIVITTLALPLAVIAVLLD